MPTSTFRKKLTPAFSSAVIFIAGLPFTNLGSRHLAEAVTIPEVTIEGKAADPTGLRATAGAAGLSGGATDLPTIIGRFIGGALGLLGVLFVVLIIYSGFLWMTAQGNDEKVKQAKKILTNAVIGLVLIFAAYVITTVVTGALSSAFSAAPPAK